MERRTVAAAEAISKLPADDEEVLVTRVGSTIEWLVLTEFGRALLLARDGGIIASSGGAKPGQILDRFDKPERDFLRRMLDSAPGKGRVVDVPDEASERPSSASFAAVAGTDWVVVFIAAHDEIFFRSQESKKALIRLLPVALFAVIFLTLIVSRAYAGSLRGLWSVAIVTSACFVAGIALIWYWEINSSERPDIGGPSLADSARGYKDYLAENFDGKQSIDMPTGLYLTYGQLTTIGGSFASADEAFVKGIVWQSIEDRRKFSAETGSESLDTLSSGVIFPEASRSAFEQEYFYRDFKTGAKETTGWSFDASLRHSFDASRFPLDRSAIELRMWHEDFEREVLLIPDLGGYRSALATQHPGLASSFQLPGWRTEGSFYEYQTVDYGMNFGLTGSLRSANATELVFKVPIRRIFVHTFVSSVLPLAIIAFLLFIALSINTKMARAKFALGGGSETMGGSTGSPTYGLINVSIVMSYTAALLFALILAHSRLRDEVPASGLLYLEYFYFVMYFAIVAVSVNALLYASHLGGGFVHFRDNLIPRVLYWPLISGPLFAVTWVVFN